MKVNKCLNCGEELSSPGTYCMKCGTANNFEEEKEETVLGKDNKEFPKTFQKSRLKAGLLGIFLGGWGMHNFYLGYSKKGSIQMLVYVLGMYFFIGPFISSIWGLVEGIMILAGVIKEDANGIQLS